VTNSRFPSGMTTRKARTTAAAKAMVIAGVMSGTSADGVDVAVCRVSLGKDGVPRVKVLAARSFAFEKRLRAAVLAVAGGEAVTAAEMARLNWRLGAVYAECVARTADEAGVKIALVACHGQTVYHQSAAARYLGAPVRCTWQMGEASVLADRLRVPVVTDFRPADLAAGGQGAPLVPMLDWCVFRQPTKNRVLLNLGGIANVTALPAGCGVDGVLAFDTGPANMVIDAVMQRLYGRGYDRGGAVAAKGKVLGDVVRRVMEGGYFSALPPKSCGREEFGAGFVEEFLALCGDVAAQDVVATATALTAASVVDAYARFCWPWLGQRAPLARGTEVMVAGGGAKNATLMRMLRERFKALGVSVKTTEGAGFAVEAKEAAAFALLGWLTWHGLAGNVPSATGAGRGVVLGKVTYA
jgi:anhydro-N-acetylmuramic acid kinase